MATTKILISGFGGQGVLFIGKFLAYTGLNQGKNVSWLPSYGPEMRGGTASCSIIISDESIGSPIVSEPDILIAMNLPSFDRYESAVVKGGKLLVDSTLVDKKATRTDIDAYYVDATQMASDNDMSKLANMIIVGKLLSLLEGGFDEEAINKVLHKVVSAKKPELIEVNMKALKMGANS